MGWFEDTVTWCAGGPWMFAALLFPGSRYLSARPGGGVVADGGAMVKEAGGLFAPKPMYGTRRFWSAGLAAPECSVVTLTESELIAHSATFDPYSQGAHQGLKSIGEEITRWRREDTSISISFTKMELSKTQKLMVGDIDLQREKVRLYFKNRATGAESIMNTFVGHSEEKRAQAWSDRSVLGGDWTADFTCFAEWWAANPTATVSSS